MVCVVTGKIALAECQRRDVQQRGTGAGANAVALIVEEEKRAVFAVIDLGIHTGPPNVPPN